MSWIKALACGLLCAAAGAACGGYIANQCAGWYRISSREGASGYFIILIGLVGLVAGGMIGMVTSLNMSGGFARQAATGLGIVIFVCVSAWAIARSGGLVPPTLRGEELFVLVEVRAPAGWMPDNKVKAGENYLTLAAVSNSSVQTSVEQGSLNWHDARVESERITIPGELFLYAASKRRVITVRLGEIEQGFVLPLPSKPTATHEQWSEWLPMVPDADPVAHGFRYRFRVQRESEARKNG